MITEYIDDFKYKQINIIAPFKVDKDWAMIVEGHVRRHTTNSSINNNNSFKHLQFCTNTLLITN